jgi:hypothetical protein
MHGSANPYDYAGQDPANVQDLDGRQYTSDGGNPTRRAHRGPPNLDVRASSVPGYAQFAISVTDTWNCGGGVLRVSINHEPLPPMTVPNYGFATVLGAPVIPNGPPTVLTATFRPRNHRYPAIRETVTVYGRLA